jgi:hypothetical protein
MTPKRVWQPDIKRFESDFITWLTTKKRSLWDGFDWGQ